MTWGHLFSERKQPKDESDSCGYPQEPGECRYWKEEVCWKSSVLSVFQVRGLRRLGPSSLGMEEMGQLGVKFMQNSRLHFVER